MRRAGRDPQKVLLLPVSKEIDADHLHDALAAGLMLFGENRVQGRGQGARGPGCPWELIGPLQGNKARRAVGLFERVESVDTAELAQRLDRIAGEDRPGSRYPVLLQVNVDADPGKTGFAPDELERELAAIMRCRTCAWTG